MTKAELLAEIERTWTALNTAVNQLTEAQLTTPQDAQGWTVKDHLMHLAAWERSAVFFLQGRPRHEGLGVEAAVYLSGDYDEINAAIYRQHKALPLAEALGKLRHTHQQLLARLQLLTDADLNQPYRHYLPDESGEGDGPPAINVIYGNSAHHFAEHLAWIEALLTREAPKTMTDLKQFVRDLNEAWKNHQYDDLYAYFHDEVAMLPPGAGQPIVGVEPMIQSYRQFGAMATIHAFHILDVTLYEYGSLAMCHLQFDMDYKIKSGRFREKGLEIYTIETSGPQPKVVWRTQLPLSENDA